MYDESFYGGQKKIAYCTPSLYISGGVERVVTTKANYLADVLGYDVYIILTDGKGREPYYKLSDKIHLVQLNIGFEEMWSMSFFRKVIAYLRKQRLFKRALKQALFDIRPDITVSTLRREINFITDIKDGSRKVGELHVNRKNYRNFEANDTNALKNLFAKIWMNSLVGHLRKLDKFVVLSDEDKANWTELNNVSVISNPLPFNVSATAKLENKKVVAAGRYVYQKGFDLLIKAWSKVRKQCPDWNLYIYGKGDRSGYEKLVTEVGASNCHLEAETNDIIGKYMDSSIFAFSSRFEGFGMVVAEAMACGVPCVSFACPCGPKDIIADGEDGLLVENGNVDQLADKLIYLMTHDEERKAMGKRAAENIKRFEIDKIMAKWNALFKSLT